MAFLDPRFSKDETAAPIQPRDFEIICEAPSFLSHSGFVRLLLRFNGQSTRVSRSLAAGGAAPAAPETDIFSELLWLVTHSGFVCSGSRTSVDQEGPVECTDTMVMHPGPVRFPAFSARRGPSTVLVPCPIGTDDNHNLLLLPSAGCNHQTGHSFCRARQVEKGSHAVMMSDRRLLSAASGGRNGSLRLGC